MANSTVGTAYLEIVPKLSKAGMPSSIPGAAQAGKQYGEEVGEGAAGALSTKSVMLGNILANVAMKAGAAFAQVFTDAFNNYADYEQLVGGVDTLFKGASQQVQANAAAAFQTAGMSANEYMENVTSFSASLIQSLGGDTQKAADYADMAIRDMSDNANKMGTDMGRITDAYQGFAKQNYTMLDNLSIAGALAA